MRKERVKPPKPRNPVAAFSRHRHAVHKVKAKLLPRKRKHKGDRDD